MTNIYKWFVTNLDCYPEKDSQQNVVFKIYYYVEAFSDQTYAVTQADGEQTSAYYQSTTCGEANVIYVASSSFTPFNQLTQDQVIGWIKESLGQSGVDAIIAKLDAEINAKINPSIANPALPWSV